MRQATITAKVKAIYTTTMDDLEQYIPEDFQQFCVFVRGKPGTDGTFPDILTGRVAHQSFSRSHHTLGTLPFARGVARFADATVSYFAIEFPNAVG
jgi:hypothetical protein